MRGTVLRVVASTLVIAISALEPVQSNATTTAQLKRTIVGEDARQQGGFGYSMNRSDDRLLVGSPWNHQAFLIDVKTGATLTEFRSPDPASTVSSFGRNLTEWGDLFAVSDFDSAYGAPGAGAVHLFDHSGNPRQTLRLPNGAFSHHFGYSTKVVGQRLFIGSVGTGTVYGYDPTGDSPAVTLQHPAYFSGSEFIDFVEDGNSVFAAASGTHLPGFVGSGVVYQFNSQTGQIERTFEHPNPEAHEGFGTSLELSKHGLLIGASVLNGAGKVYLYDPFSGELLQTLVEPEPQLFSTYFGASVAVIGDSAFVSAPYYWVDDVFGAGAVFEFDLKNGQYLGKFHSPAPGHNRYFGNGDVGSNGGLMAFGDQLIVASANTNEVFVYAVPEPSTAMVALVGCSALWLATRKYARRPGGSRSAKRIA